MQLFKGEYARKIFYNEVPRNAEQLPSWGNFQSAPDNQ